MKEIKAFESIDEIMKDYEGWEISLGIFFFYYLAYDEFNECWYTYIRKGNDICICENNIEDPELFYDDISRLINYKGEPAFNENGEPEYGCYSEDEEFSYWGHVGEEFKKHMTVSYDLESYICDYYNTRTFIDEKKKAIEIYYYE